MLPSYLLIHLEELAKVYSACTAPEITEFENKLKTSDPESLIRFYDMTMDLELIIAKYIVVDPLLQQLGTLCCQGMNITHKAFMDSTSIQRNVSMARQIFSYIAFNKLNYHPREIAFYLKQDRASIRYQAKTLLDLLSTNRFVATAYITIKNQFYATPIFLERKKEGLRISPDTEQLIK